jgi:hypothetical protein
MTLLLDAGLRDEQRKLAELARFTDRVPAPEPGFAAGRTVPVLLAGGLAAVIVGFGWNRAAGAADPRGAVPGVAIGIAGVAVLAVVTAVHLVRMRAAVEGRKAAVLRPLADRYQATLSTVDLAAAPPAGTAAQPGPATVLVAPGITRFHRTGCPTLTDVAAVAVRRGDVDPGLRPCQICEAGPR